MRGRTEALFQVITCLFTYDPQIVAVVRQMVPDIIFWQELNGSAGYADAYIWDIDGSIDIPAEITADQERPLLIIASPGTLQAMDESFMLRCCPLLKPVNGFTLRAFLDLIAEGCCWKRKAQEADQLGSDRDTLVEYVLAANLRLQQYDHQRTNFLARALHDLRAPLTALHGYCCLLADGQLGTVSPAQRELLTRMQASTRRLSKHSAGMFELSVLGHIQRKLQLIQGDVRELIAQAVHDVFLLIQEKSINLMTYLDDPNGSLYFESEQLVQVLVNILENCCKFTPVDGFIEIRGRVICWDFRHHRPASPFADAVSISANAYRIDVEDNGSGIEAHLLSSIFEEYTSYSGSRDRSGGGLGLAICKMIVTAHHGSIFAESNKGGTTFSIVLPYQAANLTPCIHNSLSSEVQFKS